MSWWRRKHLFTDGQYDVVLGYLNLARRHDALILQRTSRMELNLERLKAAHEGLKSDVTKLLALQNKTQIQVETISAELAAAIAANNPVGIAKAQADLDTMATSMEEESRQIDAVAPDPAPAPAAAPAEAPAAAPTASDTPPVDNPNQPV